MKKGGRLKLCKIEECSWNSKNSFWNMKIKCCWLNNRLTRFTFEKILENGWIAGESSIRRTTIHDFPHGNTYFFGKKKTPGICISTEIPIYFLYYSCGSNVTKETTTYLLCHCKILEPSSANHSLWYIYPLPCIICISVNT